MSPGSITNESSRAWNAVGSSHAGNAAAPSSMKPHHICSVWVTCLTMPPRQSSLTVVRRPASASDTPFSVPVRKYRCLRRAASRSARSVSTVVSSIVVIGLMIRL